MSEKRYSYAFEQALEAVEKMSALEGIYAPFIFCKGMARTDDGMIKPGSQKKHPLYDGFRKKKTAKGACSRKRSV